MCFVAVHCQITFYLHYSKTTESKWYHFYFMALTFTGSQCTHLGDITFILLDWLLLGHSASIWVISLLFYCIDIDWVKLGHNESNQTQIFTGSPWSRLSNITHFIVLRFSGSHWTHLSNITFISLHWHFGVSVNPFEWYNIYNSALPFSGSQWAEPIWAISHLSQCIDIFWVTDSKPIWVISLLF